MPERWAGWVAWPAAAGGLGGGGWVAWPAAAGGLGGGGWAAWPAAAGRAAVGIPAHPASGAGAMMIL